MALRGSTIIFKFGVSLFLARYFGLDIVGAYGLIVGLAAITPVLLQMGVFNSIARDSVTLPSADFAAEMQHYYSIVALAYLAITTAGAVVIPPLLPSLSHSDILLIACIVLAEQVGQETSTLLANRGRLTQALTVGLSQGLCWGVPLIALALWRPEFRTLQVLLGCWAIGASLPLLCLAYTVRRPFVWQPISTATLKWLFARAKAAKMLYGAGLAGSAAQYVDRYMIGIFYGLKEAGIYFLFLQVANAIFNLVNSSIVQAYRPSLIAAYHRGDTSLASRIFGDLRWGTLSTLIVASTASAAVFPTVFDLIGRPEAGALALLLCFVLAAMVCKSAYFLSTLTLYAQRRDGTLFGFSAAAVVTVSALSVVALQTGSLYAFPAANAAAYLGLIAVRAHFWPDHSN